MLSGVDPKTTFLQLVDPAELAPEFATKVRNYRASGPVGESEPRARRTTGFRGLTDPMAAAGRIHIGPDLDYLERAFDCVSLRRGFSITVAGHHDSLDRRYELTPKGAHVASI